MPKLNTMDIIGLVLAVIALVSVYSSGKIADKLVKYKDKEAVDQVSLYIKIGAFVVAVIAFLLVVIF